MSRSAAPVTKSHPPTSPNTAPATQNECHQWCASHMKRHFQLVEQVKSPSNLTKCCACHAKWMSSMICVTYETSFPMRGASKGTLQPHQILRLPRKMQVIKSPSNLTKYCACHEILKLKISAETPWMLPPIKRRFDDNPTTSDQIRPDPTISDDKIVISHPPLPRPYVPFWETILYCKIQHFASRLSPKMSRSAVPVTKSHPPTSPNTAPATESELWTVTLLNCYLTDLLLDWSVTLLICYFTELLLDWTVTWLICYFTDLLLLWSVTLLNCDLTDLLLLDWSVTLRICYFTDLLLLWSVTLLNFYFTDLLWLICYLTDLLLDWSVTLLNCYFTELLLYWYVTVLNCYFTDLWLYWTVTLLNCYFTELWLYWTVTLLNCYFTELLLYWTYFTELLLYWSVTVLNCYFTELLLYWAVTLLDCYFTELLLYWTVTLLNYYFTEFLAFLKVRNSEVSHPNFLWWEFRLGFPRKTPREEDAILG